MHFHVCAPYDYNSDALPSGKTGDLNIKGFFVFFPDVSLSPGVALTLQKEPSARILYKTVAVNKLVLPVGTNIKDFPFCYQIACLCHARYPLS